MNGFVFSKKSKAKKRKAKRIGGKKQKQAHTAALHKRQPLAPAASNNVPDTAPVPSPKVGQAMPSAPSPVAATTAPRAAAPTASMSSLVPPYPTVNPAPRVRGVARDSAPLALQELAQNLVAAETKALGRQYVGMHKHIAAAGE